MHGEGLEPECVSLVHALNMLPGITAVASCGCCEFDGNYHVAFEIGTVADLLPLATLLRRDAWYDWALEVRAWRADWSARPFDRPPQLRVYLTNRGARRGFRGESERQGGRLAAQVRNAAAKLVRHT